MRTDIQRFTEHIILGLQKNIACDKDTKNKKSLAKKEILLAYLRNLNV